MPTTGVPAPGAKLTVGEQPADVEESESADGVVDVVDVEVEATERRLGTTATLASSSASVVALLSVTLVSGACGRLDSQRVRRGMGARGQL